MRVVWGCSEWKSRLLNLASVKSALAGSHLRSLSKPFGHFLFGTLKNMSQACALIFIFHPRLGPDPFQHFVEMLQKALACLKIRRRLSSRNVHVNGRSMRQQFETSLAVFTTPIRRRDPAADGHWDIQFQPRPISAVGFGHDFA